MVRICVRFKLGVLRLQLPDRQNMFNGPLAQSIIRTESLDFSTAGNSLELCFNFLPNCWQVLIRLQVSMA